MDKRKSNGETLKKRYGESYFAELGKRGGKKKVKKGFATMSLEEHKEASRKGGQHGKGDKTT